MIKIKSKISDYVRLLLHNLPVILLAVAMFWGTKFACGTDVGVVSVLYLFTMSDLFKGKFSMQLFGKYTIITFLSVTLGTIAVMNFFAAIVINFIYMFILVYFFKDRFATNRFYIFGLEFVLMQLLPVDFSVLGWRVVSFAGCAVVSCVFLYIMSHFMKKTVVSSKAIDTACNIFCRQLSMLSEADTACSGVEDMFAVTTDFCKKTYDSMYKNDYLLTQRQRQDMKILTVLEEFSKLVYDTVANHKEMSEEDRVYFNNLQEVFIISKNQKRLAIELEYFAKNNNLTHQALNELWKKYIQKLSDALKPTMTNALQGSHIKVLKFKLKYLKNNLNMSSISFRKSLQCVTVYTVCVALAAIIPIDYSYFIPLAAFTLFTIFPRYSFKICLPQIGALVVGYAAYALTIDMLPLDYRLIAAIAVSFAVLGVTKNTLVQMVFASEAVVLSVFPIISIETSVMLRVMFILLGIVIGFAGARWLLSTKLYDFYRFSANDVVVYNDLVLDKLENMDLTQVNDNYVYEIILIEHLLIAAIDNSPNDKNGLDEHRYAKLMTYNCNFLTELSYALVAIDTKNISANWIRHCKEQIPKMADKLAKLDI